MLSIEKLLDLKGKNVVITGAASGMAKAAILTTALLSTIYENHRRNRPLAETFGGFLCCYNNDSRFGFCLSQTVPGVW